MKYKVFIHTNPKQFLGALVGRHTMLKQSASAHKFEVELIRTEDHPYLDSKHGQYYLREGNKVLWDKNDLQSFTPLRFLPPQLMGYEGRAVVTDPDVFAVRDIFDLLSMEMNGKAIAARRIRPKDGRPNYWASSVMLLDCAKLRHWQWEKTVDAMFAFKVDYRDWVSLDLEDPTTMMALPEEWNHYDLLNEQTLLLHNTGRLTQPWKSGLPIDYNPQKRPPPLRWGKNPKTWARNIKNILSPPPAKKYPTHYKRHPDPAQEKFFFRNLKEIVSAGEVTEDFLAEEISRKHVRADALEILQSV